MLLDCASPQCSAFARSPTMPQSLRGLGQAPSLSEMLSIQRAEMQRSGRACTNVSEPIYEPQFNRICWDAWCEVGDGGQAPVPFCYYLPTSAPELIATPAPKVSTGPVQTSGPTNDGGLVAAPKPSPQTWTDIAVPVPDAYAGGTPGFDFTGEEGPPSAIATGEPSPAPAAKPAGFPWGLLAVAAAVVLGS